MPPRGGRGGSFRGRGSRGRGAGGGGRGAGGGRGRGRGGAPRGRGRGFSQYGPARRFDAVRTAENDESDSEGSGDGPDAEDDESMDDIDSDAADEEDETPARPYMALMQIFSESDTRKAKKRKLDHPQTAQRGGSPDDVDEEADGEAKDLDHVDEVEEEGVEVEEQADEDDSDDEQDSLDPFDKHFAQPDEEVSSKGVQGAKDANWTTSRALLQTLRATLMSPGSNSSFDTPEPISSLDSVKLKQKLKDTAGKKMASLTTDQQGISPLLFDYRDVLYCNRTVQNAEKLRQSVCLHAINHIFKTRDRVIKNSYRLAKEEGDTQLELRDQGFTRPKVLFLLPTRNSAVQIVNTIRDMSEPDQQENRKRFDESYIEKDAKFGEDRPEDFRDLFDGNDDDMFRLGVKFTRKTVKYFAQFYSSDILIASPLGLRMAIGSEEEKGKVDYDFLSSIEMVVVDQADALLMQNWEHVEYIFEHLNLQPKEAHGCDFSRVRSWYLDDCAKYFRQTIILSAFNTPELSELQRAYCHNWAGKARLQPEYQGNIQQLGVKARQTFSRFQSVSIDKDPDARFEYFTSAIVPSLVKRSKDASGTLIFVPSYLDFVRVRNYFATSAAVSSITFGAISEYTDVPEASRARSHFLTGRHRVLLYSERAHHFRRYQFRGVQRVIFYGLPDNPIFYREIGGEYLSKSEQDMKIDAGQGTVRVMFSKYDVMKLERVAGSKRVGKMIQERGDTFDFV